MAQHLRKSRKTCVASFRLMTGSARLGAIMANPLSRPTQVLLALVLSSLSALACADVYKWTDADGQVHYSDTPLDSNATEVAVHTAPTDPARIQAEMARVEQEMAAGEEDFARRQEETRQAQAQEEERQANCTRARERRAYSVEAHRPFRISADGEREYLSSADIDALREQAAAEVQEWCG